MVDRNNSICRIFRGAPGDAMVEWIANCLPQGSFRRIVIKPNWVFHETNPAFPIRALVTSPVVIDATIRACLERYAGVESIMVGDAPLQSCEYERMLAQAGMSSVITRYAAHRGPRITFHDWRQERYVLDHGYMVRAPMAVSGDPAGYREVRIDASSFLESISEAGNTFGVSDYPEIRMRSAHGRGIHRYLLAGSALDAELFINLPKMKTHQKTGITGALKNLVGCNGDKSCLVHYRRGRPADGGDEFPPDTKRAIRAQVFFRELLQKRSRLLFRLARPVWLALKRVNGIHTEGAPANLNAGFYLAGGAWHGNDTIWRMVYDLNRIIRFAPASGGALADAPQRCYIAIMDGLVAGEGNGPLQPLPVEAGLLIASCNPFVVDMAMCRLMGYDLKKIPLLHNHALMDDEWGGVDPNQVDVVSTGGGGGRGLATLHPVKTFLAPPGWRGRIEMDRFHVG